MVFVYINALERGFELDQLRGDLKAKEGTARRQTEAGRAIERGHYRVSAHGGWQWQRSF